MVKYAKERPAKRFLVVTECGLSDRLAMEVPDKTFVKGCKLCTFMKVTTLEDVRDSLRDLKYEIDVPEEIRVLWIASCKALRLLVGPHKTCGFSSKATIST